MTTLTATLPNPLTVSLVWIKCCACGVAFGMAKHVYDQRLADRESFFCTNGHSQSFTDNTEAQLRRQLEATERSLVWAKQQREAAERGEAAAIRRASAQKANVTKLKRRAAAGNCAHCSRSFQNVERHMKTQHPQEVAAARVR